MAVKLAPNARRQFLNASGVPYSGAKLFYYAAGSTTKQNTYTTSAGDVANSSPIILDSAGRTPYGVWFQEGLTYKEVLAPANDTDPPTSPIFTEDGIAGINDTNTVVSQWISSGLTPTYVSTTSFTVPGDNTSDLHVGRRLKFSVNAGTVYGRITAAVYTSLTTVTMAMDSGQALDVGLSSFDMSILSATNNAIPKLLGSQLDAIGIVDTGSTQTVSGTKTFSGANTHSGDNTFSGNNTHSGTSTFSGNVVMTAKPVVYARVDISSPSATSTDIWVANYVQLGGPAQTFTAFAAAPQAGAEVEVYCDAAHTFVTSANLAVQGGVSYTAAVGDRLRVRARGTTVFVLELVKLNPHATKADMEAATNADKTVVPSMVVNHPGVAKAWVAFDGTGASGGKTALAGYGISGITKNATGDYTITFGTNFSSAHYGVSVFTEDDNAGGGSFGTRHSTQTRTASQFAFKVFSDSSIAVDSAFISVTFHGDQ